MTVANRVAIAFGSLVLALAGVATVMIAPERSQLVLRISSSGANEVVFPLGYWMAAGLWIWVATQTVAGPALTITARAVVVAAVFHVLLLLALYSPRLAEPSAFSSPFYWLYARAFCAAALAAATWWGTAAVRALISRGTTPGLLDLPVAAGAGVLAAGLVQHDLATAVVGTIGGAVAAIATGSGSPMSLVPTGVRRVLTSERMFLVGLFAVALGLRLLYLRQVMTNPNYVETGADGPVYDELAWSIARGEGIRDSFTNRFPMLLLGYAWFAGAVYAVAGRSYFVLCALRSAIGAAACVLLYVVAKELFGQTIARVAAAFAAVSFPLLFAAAAIGHQAIDVFLTLMIVWLLLRITKMAAPSWWAWAGVGAIFGCAIAVRETVVFFLVFVLLWIPYMFRRKVWTGALPAMAAVLAGVLVLLLPVLIPKVATEEKRLGLRIHFDRLYTGEADPNAIRTEIVGPFESPVAAAA